MGNRVKRKQHEGKIANPKATVHKDRLPKKLVCVNTHTVGPSYLASVGDTDNIDPSRQFSPTVVGPSPLARAISFWQSMRKELMPEEYQAMRREFRNHKDRERYHTWTWTWTEDEDSKLKIAVQTHGGKDWAAIAALVPSRTKIQCHDRWHNALDPS
jgi:hypothetical protein